MHKVFIILLTKERDGLQKVVVYKDFDSIYTSYIVLFTSLTLVILFSLIFFNSYVFFLFIIFYFVKFVIDLCLLYPILKFLNRKDLIKWLFPFELFYSFYIILIVILSFNTDFEWKGRVYNK